MSNYTYDLPSLKSKVTDKLKSAASASNGSPTPMGKGKARSDDLGSPISANVTVRTPGKGSGKPSDELRAPACKLGCKNTDGKIILHHMFDCPQLSQEQRKIAKETHVQKGKYFAEKKKLQVSVKSISGKQVNSAKGVSWAADPAEDNYTLFHFDDAEDIIEPTVNSTIRRLSNRFSVLDNEVTVNNLTADSVFSMASNKVNTTTVQI